MTLTELPRPDFDTAVTEQEGGSNIGAWVVAIGHVFAGHITLYGPFDSHEEAKTWHDDHGFAEDSPFDDGPTSIVPVYSRFPA